ncbi:BppU family phage baseplate upper protein, partial [Clostridium botulinum]|uniref:BppU family phage baseplate upper protein n=1 Tax=Clostridium botulinum TaxID=1491 RepID=UPI001E64730B
MENNIKVGDFMEKIFNLNIDIKDKKVMDIRGLKQLDNSSVLYITISENSKAFDLTNCTVRLNFLKEDKEVLLYMADVIDAKKGKIKIKLSTQVLKNPGLIQCDLSIFDKNIMKITSLDFTMQVEKSIYSNEYYLQKADFDIVQSMHIEEEKRLKNEKQRIENETARNTNELTRNKQENTRQDNEKQRIAEWNSVKKDANNLKYALDNTISTANNTNSNLKNTITAGDKLKVDLNINSYVKNTEYEKHKKEVTAQYEETANKLNDFGGRNYLLNSSISSLDFWSKRFQKNETDEKNKIDIKDNTCHIVNTKQDLIGIYQKPIDMDLRYDYSLSF